MAVERIIGVDFGTSTSVIRVKRYENGTYVGEKLETRDVVFNNTPITPTLVLRKNEDPSVCYFGYEAQNPKDKFTSFHSFKMDLESSDPEAKALARELTAAFYGYLAQEYKSQSDGGYLGEYEDKKRTLISYPVKWSEETKAFMLETAKKAGFPNVTGMDEAQAAIQAVTVMSADHLKKHGLLTAGQTATILLIDMGAGTTDLVLARYTPGEKPKTEILNTWPRGGDLQFGGREIDSLLPNYFRELLLEIAPPKIAEKLLNIPADQYKSWKELTLSPDLAKGESVTYFSALANRLNLLDMELDFCLDREAFETCLSGYLPQFPALVKGCLEDADVSGSDVDLVIVTGGHSQWYFVNDMLTGKLSRFGEMGLTKIQQNPARIVPISRPQETVALGLAYSGLPVEVVTPAPVTDDHTKNSEDLVNIIHEIIDKKTDDSPAGSFRLKLVPENKAFPAGGGTMVVGTVLEGSVKVGDHVYVCGGPGRSPRAQIQKLVNRRDGTTITSAGVGAFVTVQLSGISVANAACATYLAELPDRVEPPTPTDSVEELVRNVIDTQLDMDSVTKMLKKLFSNEESYVKLRSFLKVPADEPTLMAKDCTVFSTGKNGTVVTPRGIYICETYGQPYYISWQNFASGELTLEPKQGTIYLTDGSGNRKAAGYFLGETSTTALFRVYQSLQEKLREYWGIQPLSKPEPVKPTPPPQPVTPTPGGGGFKPLIKVIGDKIAENQKTKLENTLRWMESVEQDAHTIPHAPESEFEIGSAPGNNCTIRKYKGSSPIVSIPPVILGHRVVAIEKYAFSGPLATQANKAIEAVIIPSSICEIGNSAFANCINLKLVIAHKMVHTIGDAAFSGCNSLLRMDFGMGPCEVGQVHLPPALKTVGSQAFAKVLSFSIECIFKVVTISKMTKVKNPIGGKTFDPKYCAVFYY